GPRPPPGGPWVGRFVATPTAWGVQDSPPPRSTPTEVGGHLWRRPHGPPAAILDPGLRRGRAVGEWAGRGNTHGSPKRKKAGRSPPSAVTVIVRSRRGAARPGRPG